MVPRDGGQEQIPPSRHNQTSTVPLNGRLTMNKTAGYTLIELMIVVALISTLAAFAIPAYQSSNQKSYRATVKGDLQEAASRAERFKSMNFTYNNLGSSNLIPASSPFSGGDARYTISVTVPAGGATYELKAVSTSTFDSSRVEVLKLNSSGSRCISNLATGVTDCTYGTDPSW